MNKILTEEEILSLNSNQVSQFCDQFDQNLIKILQEIDENFSKANQILNQRILTKVQKHGENSQQIWESIKFWRSFFEAAANTKLNEPGNSGGGGGEESFIETESNAGLNHQGIGEDSISFEREDDQDDQDASSSATTTPRPIRKGDPSLYSDDMSPFQALQADLNHLGLPSSNESNLSAITQAVKDVHRLRLGDLPPDSPDLPEFELENLMKDLKKKGKGRAYEAALGSPLSKAGKTTTSTTTSTKTGQQSDLLHNLLRKNLSTKKPSAATNHNNPGKLIVPNEIPNNWNGIADLSITPLTGLISPTKRRTLPPTSTSKPNSNHPQESSPLPSMSFALSPHPYSQTPTKETARKVARDIYNYVDSPLLEPPSVLKNWASRGYDLVADSATSASLGSRKLLIGGVAPSPSEGRRKGFEEEEEGHYDEDEEEEEDQGARRVGTLLADFGGGTTARIDDLLGEDEAFGKLEEFNLDEDLLQQVVVVGGGGVEAEENFDHLEERVPHRSHHDDQTSGEVAVSGDYSFVDEEEEEEEEEEGMSREYEREGPEDTLFGMPQKSRTGLDSGDTEDSFAAGLVEGGIPGIGGEEGHFRVLGRSEMDTLYGGNLLESEPFEASPLANRRR